ncbi:MAG: MCE family protein [Gammaproteobacteria bacterium]|nr:MCE family protein [Gammaproteobacteria bacterium]
MSQVERFFSPPEIGAPGRREGRRRRRDLMLAGLFVTAMTVLLVGALVVVSGGTGKSYRLYTDFAAASGLKAGTPVQQAGYAIGSVASIEPVFETGSLVPRFKVVLNIRRIWRLPTDSQALVEAAGPLQGNVVKIIPGKATEPLAPGQHIRSGGIAPDITARITELTVYLQQLVDETIQPILTSLGKQVHVLETLMVAGEGEGGDQNSNIKNVTQILENLRKVSGELTTQVAAVDPDSVRRMVTSARDAADDLAGLVDSLEKRTLDIEKVLTEYRKLGNNLNRMVTDNKQAVHTSLAETQYMTQELSTALNPILNNIEGATRNLLELSREIRDNPAVILTGSKTRDNTPVPEGGNRR